MNEHDLPKDQLVEIITKITRQVLQQYGSTLNDASEIIVEPCDCSGVDLSECTSCGLCIVRRNDVKEVLDSGADRLGAKPGIKDIDGSLGSYIDHTLLKPDSTEKDLKTLCDEALKYRFAAVCVNPANVNYCVERLKGSPIKVAAVVGFPLGATTTSIKAAETREAVLNGAKEIDMVINIGALKNGDYQTVYEDIKSVVNAAGGNVVKVILETALLDEEGKIAGCVLSKAAGAHYVKTSTGFGPGGATTDDVVLMRRIVGPSMGVKASGGIRDQKTAQNMLKAGATRIGASASVAIVQS